MKNSIKYASLVSAMVLGLSACGGGGGNGGESSSSGSNIQSFQGTWKGGCEAAGNSSYKQTWELKAGGVLKNTIPVFDQANDCSGRKRGPAIADATLSYKGEVVVSNTCKDGKAQKVDLTFKKVDAGSFGVHSGDATIRRILQAQGLSFPKYDIMCIGDDGKLHTGNIDGNNDGSTEAKRPTEVNPTKAFSK